MTVLLGNEVVADTDETGNMANLNTVLGRLFTAVASGNAQQATVNLKTAGRDVYILLYDSSENLLSQGLISSSVDGDNSVALSPEVAITAGATYRIGIFPSGYTGWRGTGAGQTWDTNASTYPAIPDPYVDGGNQTQTVTPRIFIEEIAPSLAIDSTDASMQRDTNWQMVVSTPSTTPTTGNTTLSVGGDTLTPSSVTGSDPYTITFPVGDLSKQVDATGYDWTLTVDAETATTGNIPLAIQAGYTLVDLVDPVTTNQSLLFGAVGTPVTTDHLEYIVTSTLDANVSLSDVAANAVWTVTETVEGAWVTDITVSRRVVQADGTIGTEAVVTLSAATGLTTLVGSLVQDAVSGIISNMVN